MVPNPALQRGTVAQHWCPTPLNVGNVAQIRCPALSFIFSLPISSPVDKCLTSSPSQNSVGFVGKSHESLVRLPCLSQDEEFGQGGETPNPDQIPAYLCCTACFPFTLRAVLRNPLVRGFAKKTPKSRQERFYNTKSTKRRCVSGFPAIFALELQKLKTVAPFLSTKI